jgi:hypothetical protein
MAPRVLQPQQVPTGQPCQTNRLLLLLVAAAVASSQLWRLQMRAPAVSSQQQQQQLMAHSQSALRAGLVCTWMYQKQQ